MYNNIVIFNSIRVFMGARTDNGAGVKDFIINLIYGVVDKL